MAGCASVTSTRREPRSSEAPKNGLSYFLPRGHVVVTLSWNPALRSWNAAPTIVIEADPSARFDVDWVNSILADKDTVVAVDPATGLLQSVNAGVPNENVNTIGAVIGAPPNVIRLSPSIAPLAPNAPPFDLGAAAGPTPGAPAGLGSTAIAQVVVDDRERPEGIAFVASPPSARPRLYAAIRVTLTPRFEIGPNFPADRNFALSPKGTGGGIVVRLPMPYELNVEERISTDANFRNDSARWAACSIAPRIVMLPDSAHDFLYRVLSRPLISDQTKVALSNGMIESVNQVRPSILGSILAIPKYLVNGLVPVPVEITQTQQNVSNSQSRISTEEAAGTTVTEEK